MKKEDKSGTNERKRESGLYMRKDTEGEGIEEMSYPIHRFFFREMSYSSSRDPVTDRLERVISAWLAN